MIADHQTNINALREGLVQCVKRHILSTGDDHRVMYGTIDLDRFPIEVHGRQQGSNYNASYLN